jgi:hypothetical protein
MSLRDSKLGDSNRMFSYLRVVGASSGSAKLQDHCAMCLRKLLIGLFCLPLFAQSGPTLTPAQTEGRDDGAVKLRAVIEASPKLPLEPTDLALKLPQSQELGMVSWLARDAKTGVTWLTQRGDKADPVMAVDLEGDVLHSFGKGLYKIPHTIRLDPEGNVGTVDAGSSTVIKFSPNGKRLLEIDVGGQPEPAMGPFRGAFLGTTDIALAPKGRIFISDGYANARILEYTADGRKVREWGSAGAGPGQFRLPHSIVADQSNILYVADRENGRIEKFDLDGKFLGEIPNLGRTYSLQLGAKATLGGNASAERASRISRLGRQVGSPERQDSGLCACERAGGPSLRGGRRRGPAFNGRGNRIVWFKSRSLGGVP